MAQVSEVLDNLIEICAEAENCYRACARLMQEQGKSRALLHCAKRAARARRHLTKLAAQIGDTPCDGPVLAQPAAGTPAFAAVSDAASALGMCERLEAVTMMRYRDALDFDLPLPARKMLQRQFDELLQRHAHRERERARPSLAAVGRMERLAIAR